MGALMGFFSLRNDEPVQLEHFCVCTRCGNVFGPLRYFPGDDDISRMNGCCMCDRMPEDVPHCPVSNVGDFAGAGLRALCREARP